MKTIYLFIFLTFILNTCQNQQKNQHEELYKRNVGIDSLNNNKNKSTSIFTAMDKVIVSTKGEVYLSLEKNSTCFIFGLNSCECTFASQTDLDTIKVKWNLVRKICDFDLNLNQTFGLKDYPKKDSVFMKLYLLNDTILFADYLYPDFIRKQNETARKSNNYTFDTLFPTVFFIRK